MISGFLLKLGNSLKVLLAVIGLASMYPEVEIDNVSVYRESDSIFIQFDTVSILNNSIMQIIDSGITVDFTYSVDTTMNGKIVYRNDYLEQISAVRGKYRVNNEELLTFAGLKKRMRHHEFKIYRDIMADVSRKAQTVIQFGLSCRETPNLLKLWGNKPRITVNFSLR